MWVESLRSFRVHLVRYMLVVIVVCVATPTSAAIALDEAFYSGNNILFYDPDATICSDSTETTTSRGFVESSDNVKALLEFFTAKGFSLAAASGIAGNIKQESGFNPAIIQGGEIADDNVDIMTLRYSNGDHKGFGLAQWTSPDRKLNLVNYAKQTNRPITDLNMQLGFIWKEMKADDYTYMNQKLDENKSDPVAAAAVFHGRTPDIQREGSNIHPKFIASGARLGYERSGDTSREVIVVRGGAAASYYKNYQGHIQDGGGVGRVSDTAGDFILCEDGVSGDDLGPGKGKFTDSGEVAGWNSVLTNAQRTNKVFGTTLVGKNCCAAITAKVWQGKDTGYGFDHAIHLWERLGGSVGHKDRNPKKGAILLYDGSQAAGHVVIYLGNNKILNDGNITNADFVEGGGWNQRYLGWVDPNDVGWSTRTATEDEMKRYMANSTCLRGRL